jgi:hypothetical protein
MFADCSAGQPEGTFAMASDPTRLPARFVFIAAHAKDPNLLQHVASMAMAPAE